MTMRNDMSGVRNGHKFTEQEKYERQLEASRRYYKNHKHDKDFRDKRNKSNKKYREKPENKVKMNKYHEEHKEEQRENTRKASNKYYSKNKNNDLFKKLRNAIYKLRYWEKRIRVLRKEWKNYKEEEKNV